MTATKPRLGKPQRALRADFLRLAPQGVLKTSEWTTGTGRYVKTRSLPFGVMKVRASLSGENPRILAFFTAHPRCEACLFMSDEEMAFPAE